MTTANPYRWHILLGLCFFLLVTFVFFALAAKPAAKVEIVDAEGEAITTPTVTIADPQIGAAEPQVTIVEFADYTCEACARLSPTLQRLLAKYPNAVKLVWKDFPNESKDDQATPSAIAARCADNQNVFWQYHDELFLRQSQLGEQTYLAIAENLGLNVDSFTECLQTSEPLPRVRKAFDEGLALSITATPTLFVNGERYTGGVSFEELEALVKAAIYQ